MASKLASDLKVGDQIIVKGKNSKVEGVHKSVGGRFITVYFDNQPTITFFKGEPITLNEEAQ